MKTMKAGVFITAIFAVMCAFAVNSNRPMGHPDTATAAIAASAGTDITPVSNNEKYVWAAPKPSVKFARYNMAVENDLSMIQASTKNVNMLKAKLKADCKADNKAAVIADKKALAKAKADMKRDKAYLAADRKELERNHKLFIAERRDQLKHDESALAKAEAQLHRDVRNMNSGALENDAAVVAMHQRTVKSSEVSLANAEKAYDNDLAAIDNRIELMKQNKLTTNNQSSLAQR